MRDRYTTIAIALHWLIPLLLVGQFAFGLTGIVIGLPILARVAWRVPHVPPALPDTMPAWERRAVKFVPAALYVCVVMLPLSGYLASNFSEHGLKFFDLVRLPPWGPDDRTFAALLLALSFAVHVLALAEHMQIDRDKLLRRMWLRRLRLEPR